MNDINAGDVFYLSIMVLNDQTMFIFRNNISGLIFEKTSALKITKDFDI